MKFVDLSGNSRMALLMDLTRALRGCQSPYDALLMYLGYLREAYPGRAHMMVSTIGLAQREYRVWRVLTDDGVEHLELRDPWKNLNSPIFNSGVIARIVERQALHWVDDIDWSDDPHFGDLLKPYRSVIAVPMLNDGLPLNWSLLLTRDPKSVTQTQLEETAMRATMIGSLLGNLHIARALADAHAQIDSDLLRMSRIQRALLPEPIPQIPGLRLAASYETFGQVGGDLYDFLPLSDDATRWCFFIGDASGHGPSAAVVAAMVQATLHDCAIYSNGPADLFRMLNRRLCKKPIEGSFVTAFMGFYEPSTRRLRYASAGHPTPLLLSRSGKPTQFLNTATGVPLRIDEGAAFNEATIDLQPGNTLLMYTDGISEARGPDNVMFTTEGIERSLSGFTDDAQYTIDRLRRSLIAHQQGRRPEDDQTAVAIHVDSFGV